MGYDLHVTRAIDWTANEGLTISSAEWLEFVEVDKELWRDPANGPYAARMSAKTWFDWFEGNIFTTDPEAATVRKMLEIAERLSAAVQGDDGEFYDSASQWSSRIASMKQDSSESP
ncbi:MAG: hypothetical protein ACYTG5_06420 [Planctomycetota bacterium]|jgi:hypothetical protein